MRYVAVAVAICLAAPARAQPGDWTVKRDPFDAGVVRRYKAILARDPHDAGALRELVTMYRRHRTLATLESEYQKQLGASQDWATLVVLARLPRPSRAESIALWDRALKASPNDARGWLALGDLAADAKAARDAYQHAAKHATSDRQRRAALTKLVGAAKSAGDAAVVDAAYGELVAIAPRDGVLWLDRGDAQLAARRFDAAITSFTTAESLLKTDPERRLAAMVVQGTALERLGRVDDAIAQYVRTLDAVPRGYYLGREIVPRIIDAERRRNRLPSATALFENRWPERSRGHFEWATLGDLYKEAGDRERALAAYKAAVGKAATEVTTQRKLIEMLDVLRPGEALGQLEAAARVAPGDADLQFELAKRYHPTQPDKAFATLDRLSRRMSRHVNVRRVIAQMYTQWEQPTRAITEYEAIAALEPHDPDHLVVLGEQYWDVGQAAKARTTWERLERLGTITALLRYGEVLKSHLLWTQAVDVYTKAIALEGTNAEAWRGRAQAHDALKEFPNAIEDARRAVALIGNASREDGDRERHLLVRVLGHSYTEGSTVPLTAALERWRFAFDRGDIGAGYLLAAHHARIASHQQHDVLVDLYRRVPTDDSLGIAVAHSYRKRKEYGRARDEAERVARRTPARKEEVAKLIAGIEMDRQRDEAEARWEGIPSSNRRLAIQAGRGPDLVGQHRRFGVRLAVGSDIRNASGALLGLGLYRMHGVADGTAISTRLEWTQRDDTMERFDVLAASVGVAKRIAGARSFELAAGIAPRLEVRYGIDTGASAWNRAGVVADFTLDLLPRALPAVLGLRFQQMLTEASNSSAIMLELGFEVR